MPEFSKKQYICKKQALNTRSVNIFYQKLKFYVELWGFLFLMTYGSLQAAEDSYIMPFRYNYELSVSKIHDITQDPIGRIWMITPENLFFFDGYQTQKISIPSVMVPAGLYQLYCLYADTSGQIWIGTSSGVLQYNPTTEHLTHYFPYPDDPKSKSNVVYDIQASPEGMLYFATRNGIFFLPSPHSEMKRFTHFAWHQHFDEKTKSERIARSILFDRAGGLWIGTEGNGLLYLNLKDGTRNHFKANPMDSTSLAGNQVLSLYEDRFGVIRVGTTEGLSAFNREKSVFTTFKKGSFQGAINCIVEAQNGSILLGSEKGFAVYDRQSQKALWFTNTPSLRYTIPSNLVEAVFQDRSGNIWIGTAKGLATYQTPNDFSLLRRMPGNDQSLTSNQLQFIIPDKAGKKLWIGTRSSGIDLYDPAQNYFRHYPFTELLPLNKNYRHILTGYVNAQDELIVGTAAGLVKIKSGSSKPSPFGTALQPEQLKNTYAIAEDAQGRYWLGILDKGVYLYDPKHDDLRKIHLIDEKSHRDLYTNIKILYPDQDGYLWVVFWQGGLLRYNPQTGESRHFTRENTAGALPNNTIWDLYEDQQGRLIIATVSGLALLDPAKENFFTSTWTKALASESVVGILSDATDSQFWLSTATNGIFHINTLNGEMIHFTEADGLQGNNFIYQIRARLDTLLFFGGDNGLNYTTVNTRRENRYVPHPQLIRLKINGTSIPLHHLKQKNELPHVQIDKRTDLELSFSSFSYQKDWRNLYRYRLTGRDTSFHWLLPSTNNIELRDLERGNYTFELSGSNSDGLWSIPQPLLTLKVTNQNLRYFWFIPILLFLSGIGIYSRRKKSQQSPLPPLALPKTAKTAGNNSDLFTGAQIEKLRILMEEEKIYTNKQLNKTQLASLLKLSEQQLTLLLKNCYGKSFPDFINYYRIEAVKQKLESTQYQNYTLLAIGEESGFNSKSSFYRVFKEYTGVTPAEYLDRLKTKDK